MKYTYVPCEEGASQYDELDLKSQNIVPALYVPARLQEDSGNPYIEALPYPRDNREIMTAYSHPLSHFMYDKVKNMSKLDKMLQVGTLRNLRFPLPFHKDLEFNMYNALVTSYRSRKQFTSQNGNIKYVSCNKLQPSANILTGDSSAATNAGFSLIGYSGCGKSSAINILVSHYPQVIMHGNEVEGYYPQITYLVVNCIANSNFDALYQSIGDAIDKAFENIEPVYAIEIERTKGLGKKAEKIKNYIEKFAIGVIIFDEIQLIDFEHTRENSFDSLLTLANRTKVAIAVVGTEDARNKMFHELRTARRVGTMINGNLYCSNKEFFGYLVKNLFNYQWFDEPIPVANNLVKALYDVTQGIVDQLIGIYSCMNYEYLEKKSKPTINDKYVYSIAKKYYPGIQNVLSNLKFNENERILAGIRQNAEVRVNNLLDKARQEQEANRLIKGSISTNETQIELKNIVSTITALYDEYTETQIEDAFNKIIKRKSSEGKTEREISRLVIDLLQKAPTRKIPRNRIDSPDTQHMRDFLGIGKKDE